MTTLSLDALAVPGRLEPVSLTVEHGERVVVVGPSGAGKSTLLDAIFGLAPSTGSAAIDGQRLADLDVGERARRIAYVPQESGLAVPLAVRDVIAMARYAHAPAPRDRELVEHAAREVGVEALLHRSFTSLSGGERRRVLIARALATEAKILVLDEPTHSLDVGHALRTLAVIESLAARGHALLGVLHDLRETLRLADRVLVLHRGRVATSGPPSVLRDADVLRDVFGVRAIEAHDPRFELEEST